MEITYKTKGVCARAIKIVVEHDIVKLVEFEGGCNGNTKGIANLAVGMRVEDVINRLQGVKCGFKGTSCPDQLAEALKTIKSES